MNITYILNVSQHCAKPDFIEDSKFLRISIDDSHCAKLLPYFDIAFKFIGTFLIKFIIRGESFEKKKKNFFFFFLYKNFAKKTKISLLIA